MYAETALNIEVFDRCRVRKMEGLAFPVMSAPRLDTGIEAVSHTVGFEPRGILETRHSFHSPGRKLGPSGEATCPPEAQLSSLQGSSFEDPTPASFCSYGCIFPPLVLNCLPFSAGFFERCMHAP